MTRLCSAGRHDRAIGVARILHDEVGGLASSPRHPFRRQYGSRILSRCVRRARPERPLRSSVLRIKGPPAWPSRRKPEQTLLMSGGKLGSRSKGLLLWLIGIPIPIILLIWIFGFLH
jgi:hypothetical protein